MSKEARKKDKKKKKKDKREKNKKEVIMKAHSSSVISDINQSREINFKLK